MLGEICDAGLSLFFLGPRGQSRRQISADSGVSSI